MPRMNGFQLLAALQADAALRNIPFVFISASVEPERIDEASRLGASAYVTKPFNLGDLRRVLQQFFLPGSAPT